MGFSFRLILPEARGKRKPKERKRERERKQSVTFFLGFFMRLFFLVLIFFFEYFYKYFILFHGFTQQVGLHTFFPALKLTKFDGIGEVRFSNRS